MSSASECVSNQTDFLSEYGNYVKPAGRIRRITTAVQVILRGMADPGLLAYIHSLLRIAGFTVPAVFHFYKYQIHPIPGDQVDLPRTVAVVAFQNLIAFLLQKSRGLLLVAAAFRTQNS